MAARGRGGEVMTGLGLAVGGGYGFVDSTAVQMGLRFGGPIARPNRELLAKVDLLGGIQDRLHLPGALFATECVAVAVVSALALAAGVYLLDKTDNY